MAELFDLERFVQAQRPVIAQVKHELAAGRKATHWMWFVFPQLRGLGHSAMAQRYGIVSLAEAAAYLRHELLGVRLLECTELANRASTRSVSALFGSPDDMKFRSCMPLFAKAAPGEPVFKQALARYFGGEMDPRTIASLDG